MDYERKTKQSPNPKENAGFLSTITFFYALKTLRQGLRKEFTEDDIYETLFEHKSKYLGNTVQKLWQGGPTSLHTTMIKLFIRDLMLIGLALGVQSLIMRPVQAFALAKLTKYFTQLSKEKSSQLIFTGILLNMCLLSSVIIFHPSTMGLANISLKMKIACSSLIYKKMLKLNQSAFEKSLIGQIINLLQVDTNVFDKYIINAHYLWIGPLQTILYLHLMYQYIGLSAIIGIVFLLLFIPLYFILGYYISKYRVKASLKRDKRLRLTNEIFKGIHTIKMQTWEKLFDKLLSESRNSELKYVRIGLYLKGLVHLQTIFTAVPLFITVMMHALLNNQIDAEKLFLLTNLYNNVGYTMATVFPQGIIALREAFVSFKRIETFLSHEEVLHYTKTNQRFEAVTLRNVTVQINRRLDNVIFKNFNLIFPSNKLSVILGPVGSGKTTLLHTMINEVHVSDGDVIVNGTISYSSQDPWIFFGTIEENILFGDDVDPERYKRIISVCALENDFNLLPYGDKTLVGEKGVSLSGGQKARINLARAVYKNADMYLFDDPLSAVDVTVGKKIFHDCFQKFLKGKTVILVTHQTQYLHNADNIVILCNGKTRSNSEIDDWSVENCDIYWSNQKEQLPNKLKNRTTHGVPRIALETKSSGLVSWSVYKYYISGCQSTTLIVATIVLFILSQITVSGISYFTKHWVNLEQDDENISKTYFLCIYVGLITITIVLAVLKMFCLYAACIRSSKTHHQQVFDSLLRANISFFNENSSGRILNRLSKDINVIDEHLPISVYVILQHSLSIIGSLILIVLVNPWLIVPSLIIVVIFYYLNFYYLSSAISLKRLENITRSPVLEHLISSFQGLYAIRVFRTENIIENKFNHLQDLHSCTNHLTLTTSRAFGFWLDVICFCYICVIIFTLIVTQTETYGGNIGLLLTQAIQLLGYVQLATKQCAEIENHMTSVERLREFYLIDHEDQRKQVPNRLWPNHGKIRFRNVYLKYQSLGSYILKNINFTIQSQEKVGIVGRTASGKSTLVFTLFQLIHVEGTITIDDVNIRDINLNTLRSKLLIIPQYPLLFSGTVRRNLDVLNEYKDEKLWKALEDVELKETFKRLNLGLDSELSEDGCNLSLGQKQLMCLARAILSKKKIIILDEATASIDSTTDVIIQKVIRQKFMDCTVLTIAHRLLTVIDSDKILLMEDGNVLEFDHPYILLQNKSGDFYKMVHETNETISKVLIQTAEKAYNKHIQEQRVTKI